MEHRNCPHCCSDQRDKEIPRENWDFYGITEETPEEGRYFYRTIGVELRGVYDGVLFWQCPDCGGRWHRFEVGSRLHEAAQRFIEIGNVNLGKE